MFQILFHAETMSFPNKRPVVNHEWILDLVRLHTQYDIVRCQAFLQFLMRSWLLKKAKQEDIL